MLLVLFRGSFVVECSHSAFLFILCQLFKVYWLPPNAEEKISLSMTVLLAFSVFLFVVNDLTPASSDSTPIIG